MLGMDQDAFAQKIGISKRSLYGRENDKSFATMPELAAMVEMGANPMFLLTGKGHILRGEHHERD